MTMTIEDLSPEQFQDLVERTLRPTDPDTRERRKEFHARRLAMKERSKSLVSERIKETFHDPYVKSEVNRWATSIFNPIRRLSELAAKAYSTPPVRRIEGISDEQERDYLRLLEALAFNAKAKSWNQWQIASNTVAVLVRPRRSSKGDPTVDFLRITGESAEVVLNPDAPAGDTPGVLAYTITPAASEHDPNAEVMATVDSRWWTFFNVHGQPLRAVEHGLGIFPGAIIHIAEIDGDDPNSYWNPDFGRSTTEALKEAGLVGAIMNWARKSGFGKLVALLRDDDVDANSDNEGDAGQTIGQPESVLELDGQRLQVENIEVQIKEFREHMGLMLSEAARGLTGSASILDEPRQGQPASDTADVHRHAAMRQFQQESIVYLQPWEHEIHEVIARMGARIGMRGVPPWEAIRDGFRAEFQPLLFLDTPQERINVAIAETKFGVNSPQNYVRANDGVSAAEAERRVMVFVDQTAEVNELRAKRMSASDPTNVDDEAQEIRPELAAEGSAEATGRRGGRASPA